MIDQTISHYKILEELGAGGMGVVYKAEDTKLKRTVALKFLSPQSLGSKKEQSRFIHEAQAAAALDHSNICTVYEIAEVEGKSFIAMSYVDGPSLKEEVESGPLDVDRAVDIAIQVAEGLREAHEKGIIHRDIKSANIMLTSKGQAKITDFGLAKLPGRTKLTKTGTTVGTLAYMSPEQAQGAEVDHRSDIWSLGVVLYELLTGKVPFRGDHEVAMVYSIMNQDVEPPSKLTPAVPAELDSIVAKMLQRNPDDRYASPEELISDLRKVQTGAAVKVALPMSAKTKRVMRRRSTALWFAAVAATVVIAVIVTSLLIKRRSARHAVAIRTQITFVGNAFHPALSPDGTYAAYSEQGRVMVRELSGGQPIEVFRDQRIWHLCWSPDGKTLLVKSHNDSIGARNHVVPRLGGSPRRYPGRGGSCSWSPDGTRFASVSLYGFDLVDTKSGTVTPIPVDWPFDWVDGVNWSSASELMLIQGEGSEGSGLWLVREDGRGLVKLRSGLMKYRSAVWSPRGDAIYYLEIRGHVADLVKLPVDPRSGTQRGEPVVLLSGVDGPISISADAKRLLHQQELSWSNLWLVDLEGTEHGESPATKKLTSGTSRVSIPFGRLTESELPSHPQTERNSGCQSWTLEAASRERSPVS
jgi:tRNA A-37 threonylcarbamoyl transferase component Bud32/Tol biopolymer transport system component